MAYDKMDWHYGGDFPENIPNENGGTHIGMFLAWIIERNLIGAFHTEDEFSLKCIKKVQTKEITGRKFLIDMCDEKFWDEDLNEEGNLFATDYYAEESEAFIKQYNCYLDDYVEVFQDYETIYHVEDTWGNYDKLKPVLDKRFEEWKKFKTT